MLWILLAPLLSFNISLAHTIPVIPDPELTYGSLCTTEDSDFEEFRYEEQIPYCRRNVSFWRRSKIYEAYSIPEECRHNYTIDHFIPLSIGGSNADNNLWPEHELVKSTRGRFEFDIFIAMRDGDITQEEALDLMVEEKTSLELDVSDHEGCD